MKTMSLAYYQQYIEPLVAARKLEVSKKLKEIKKSKKKKKKKNETKT